MSNDKRALQQAQAQVETIVEIMKKIAKTKSDNDREKYEEEARNNALEVSSRGGWHSPGSGNGDEEFMILLCTGGPAVRIVGDLDEHSQPCNPRVEHQDWGTPWTEYQPKSDEVKMLEEFCSLFYFGD